MVGDEDPRGADSASISGGISYTVGPDGSWSAETELGSVRKDVDGSISAKFDHVKTISVGDVTMLLEYSIQEHGRSTIHHIKFRNGGHCFLAYTETGEITDFRIGKLKIHISFDGILTLTPKI